jgi:hypothetical protein
MEFLNVSEALQQTWTRVYVRFLALVLAFGGMVHVGNMLGLNGVSWRESALHLRVMDVVLLAFNVIVGLGLWFRLPWALVAFVGGIITLQIVPYTLFRRYFIQRPEDAGTLTGLVVTVILLLGILVALVAVKK